MNESDYTHPKGKNSLPLIVFIAVVLLALGFSVFFRVTTITVNGEHGVFTENEIITASGIKTGKLIFLVNSERVADNVETEFPTLSNVMVSRILPSTIIITAEESTARVVVTLDGADWLMDENGHILFKAEAGKVFPRVMGLSAISVTPGCEPETEGKDTYRLDFIKGVLHRLKNENLILKLTEINTENIAELNFVMDDKYLVKVGSSEKLEYKLSRFVSIYSELSVPGTVDVSEEGKSYFIPD